MKGDYQAQRNLAFSYVNPLGNQKADPVLGCAWYQVILLSGSPKVHDGDRGNVEVYCGNKKLDKYARTAADRKAKQLAKKVYGE